MASRKVDRKPSGTPRSSLNMRRTISMAEAPTHVIDIESEVRCPAGKMYDLLKNHFTDLPVLFNEICKSAEVLEGDGKSLGSVRRWTYLMHDTSDELLEVIEKVVDVDDENRSLTLSAIGGDVLRTHKRFDVKVIVTPKGTGSSVKWHIIFEKVNEDDPHPDPYLELFNTTHERLELHYHKDE
ncbi:hypothetical protein Syun_022077 [Stephania yunnanensis]|uniref:Bet v I/Major latex protein domain-containing protein n=1 Tax=Stephania yunnanensis TaxID=152371 RepID=A0AAP0IH95_9MAGN